MLITLGGLLLHCLRVGPLILCWALPITLLSFTAAEEGKAEGADVKEEEGEQTEEAGPSKESSPNKWSRPAPLKVGTAPDVRRTAQLDRMWRTTRFFLSRPRFAASVTLPPGGAWFLLWLNS
jgi:hypothetical protein